MLRREGWLLMADLIVENIVCSTNIHQELSLETLLDFLPDASLNEEDRILIVRFNDPKRAVLITEHGKICCTGSKSIDECEETIAHVITLLNNHNVLIDNFPDISLQSVIISTDLGKRIELNQLSNLLQPDQIRFKPNQNPWVEYTYDEHTVFLICSSGKIICTSNKTIDHAEESIENLLEILDSV